MALDIKKLNYDIDQILNHFELGLNTPTKPYFFMQEFKKGKKSVDDAEGQMLVAMLIAQTLNADKKPVYGWLLDTGKRLAFYGFGW
ncbi:MAG: hypothetical protein RLZZ628_2694 [Bacteroidota bacterium]|jgi:hypothetical protein